LREVNQKKRLEKMSKFFGQSSSSESESEAENEQIEVQPVKATKAAK